MTIKSRKGLYEIVAVFKDAFNLEKFEECYIEECLDKYPYIVGDLSDGLLRLKGFSFDARKENYYKNIPAYLEKSCVFEAPYYILRRLKDETEYEKLKDKPINIIPIPNHLVIDKENFDKESLNLESSKKNKPNIILDINRINEVPLGKLPLDLKENDEVLDNNVTTVVASEGFVPVKREFNNRKNYRKKGRN